MVKIKHVERLDYADALVSAELALGDLTHRGIHMYRIDSLHVGMLVYYAAYGSEHMHHRLSEVFASVRGYHDEAAAICPFKLRMCVIVAHRGFQCVDRCISRDVDRALSFPSRRRLSRESSVGAKLYLAIMPTACLLNSSGYGEYILYVRSPAST